MKGKYAGAPCPVDDAHLFPKRTASARPARCHCLAAHQQHFASWFGLTPKEHSSGGTRHLGRISKRGDRYLRMLLTHGARSVLRAATVATQAGREPDSLRRWALGVQARSNHNKAACALANKMARICYATLRDGEPYGSVTRMNKKIERTAFALPG
ncbi:MAG: transposase [Betaproteobacteria bacterium]